MLKARPRMRRWLKRLILVTLFSWVAIVILLKTLESQLVFRPNTAGESWHKPPDDRVADVYFANADGTPIHGWWFPSTETVQAILVLHGNGGNLSHRGQLATRLRETLHRPVLMIDYPGYGKSGGEPCENGCYEAATAALDWLNKEKAIEPRQVTIFGESLGGGVAVDLASRKDCAALVLVKTFTSVPDVGQSLFPWLPVRWLMSNRFDSAAKIGNVKRPLFMVHGTADRTVPYRFGEKLFVMANEPKHFMTLDGHAHHDALPDSFYFDLKGFLNQSRH